MLVVFLPSIESGSKNLAGTIQVNSLFFVQKFNFDFPRKLSIFLGEKLVKNVVVLDFLAVDNFDFTRKFVKEFLDEKLVKIMCFLTFLLLTTLISREQLSKKFG